MTDQQRRVCALLQRGWTDREIAREINVSHQRVGQIVTAIAAKLPGKGKPRRKILEAMAAGPSAGV